MKTIIKKITGNEKTDDKIIKKAADIIKRGGLVAIPTETVYGLAGSALLEDSARKIFEAKGRPSDNPLIVHIAVPEDAEKIAYPDERFYRLAREFMPGPLTVILKKKENIPTEVTGGLDTVAVRCPSNPVAHRLIEVSGHPIAAPSANRSGIPSPTCAEHVIEDMDGRIDMIIDAGRCDIGLESTVVKLTDYGCMILRPGAITAEMLEKVCGNVKVAEAVTRPDAVKDFKAESPGMKYKHYSPKAEVLLVECDDKEFSEYVRTHVSPDGTEGVITTSDKAEAYDFGTENILCPDDGNDAKAFARSIFFLLREADTLGWKKIYIKCPPKDGVSLALYNRLIRSAGGNTVKP